jgi:2-polyprenyl-3-methyl-5-hydroxy-6-metoxy-1,4-benzoquinol methylase
VYAKNFGVISTPTLSSRLADFATSIAQARSSVPDPSLPWYLYNSLANVGFLEQLLAQAQLDLEELVGSRRILDIGCADGEMAFFMESLGFPVCAVDFPATNANQMRGVRALKTALRSSIEIVEADLDAGLMLARERFGFAVFLGLLYHLKNPYLVLESLSRIADYCVLSTRVARYTANRATAIHDEPVAFLLDRGEANADVTNFWIFSEAGLRRLIRLTGWEICAHMSVGNTKNSDPVTSEGDERFFCLLRRSSAFTNGKLISGWHEPETEAADWRWSDPVFQVEFRPQHGEAELQLGFYLTDRHVMPTQPITLRVSVDGKPPAERQFAASGHHRLTLAYEWHERSGPVRVQVEVSPAHPPAPPDPRELGIIVNQIRLVPSLEG